MNIIITFQKFIPYIYSIISLILIMGFIKNRNKNWIKWAVFLVFILEIAKFFSLSFYQYYLWRDNSISKFLLPPYQGIGYFLNYVGYRFFLPFLFSLLIAFLFYFFMRWIDKKRERKLFEEDEPWHLFFSFLILNHPLWLFYLMIVLLFGLLSHLFRLALWPLKKHAIFSLYYLWLPSAFIIFLINYFILKIPFLMDLKF